jgi:hypothetical protein
MWCIQWCASEKLFDFSCVYLAQSAIISRRCWVNPAMMVTGSLAVSQSIVQIVLVCEENSRNWSTEIWLFFPRRQNDHIIIGTIIEKTLVDFDKWFFILFWSCTVSYRMSKYLIPSGIFTFFPFTPSASKTNGKSDSKLFTVNNRLTNDESNRYNKTE